MATVELQLSPQMIDWVADQGGYTPSALAEELMPKKRKCFYGAMLQKQSLKNLQELVKFHLDIYSLTRHLKIPPNDP